MIADIDWIAATKEIFVYSGLIDLLEKEEPLIAAVMAHEISTYKVILNDGESDLQSSPCDRAARG